ncbi:uncharacterized protein LOC131439955 isoform X2 [Malaya genurostris]|uniref:uncharacterized protein LOC131439955 isoform X2 n=1 Tax=Malaya genurostris TaxID=325434 RepID=UPI0026F3D6BA|nr:uncharacterized protein LOC131439955 isoform X2 [Malaya genurostris]
MSSSKIIRICNSSRKKTIIKTYPKVTYLIEKAQRYFHEDFSRIVLEDDGSTILDDEVVDACADGGLLLMLLNDNECWKPPKSPSLVTASAPSTFDIYDDVQIVNLQNDIESNAPTSDGTNPSTSNVPVEPFESAPKFISSNCLETIDKAPPSSTTQYFLSSNNHSILDHQCDVFPPSRALKRSFDVIENEPNESTEIQTNPVLLVAKNRKTSRIDASTTLLLSQFEIDWSIIPFDIISQLENTTESVLNETDYNRFVDHIVGQTRNITTSTPLSVYRQIAQVIVNKYNFFIDVDDDGIIIGNGCSSLIEKLKNRNSYLNRAHKSGHHNKNLKLGDDPMRQCRIGIRDNYYFTGEPHVPKSCLQKLLKNIGWDMDLLTSSKSYIRFKMDSSSINDLMDNFPILRRKAFLEYHFFEATGVEAENFKNNFLEKRDRIISLSQTYRNKSLHIQNSADDKCVFSGIARLLKEELTEIIHEVEADDTEETIVKQYPIIVAIVLLIIVFPVLTVSSII